MINLGNLLANNVRRHPQSQECQLLRPVRTGVSQTVGGLRLLGEEDEDVLSYAYVGSGYMLPVDEFAPSEMNDAGTVEMDAMGPRAYLIAPEAGSGMPGWFAPQKDDVILLVISDALKLAWEVVGLDTTTDYPVGLSLRYQCSRRADLDVLLTTLEQDATP